MKICILTIIGLGFFCTGGLLAGVKPEGMQEAVETIARSEAVNILVLVNKNHKLPANYRPDDLIEPKVPFVFNEISEKRLLRKEAALALERMFAAARKDGIYLAGVSGYRSYPRQEAVYSAYVYRDGEFAANRYSAKPGHSEHQTGLAIDVSGSNARCAVQDCFGETDEARWIRYHSKNYGFIIRFPEHKEQITGYKYEPWHLRYVGVKPALEIAEKELTLEEWIEAAVYSQNISR